MQPISQIPILILLFCLNTCGEGANQDSLASSHNQRDTQALVENPGSIVHPEGNTILERVAAPDGFQRKGFPENSFAYYLRHLPLKPHGAQVLYYNGKEKPNEGIYVAVVDMPIGDKNLHQCADAVMRLRAEYLWQQKRYEAIHFNFTNGFRVDYSEWMQGQRIMVEGNRSYWTAAGSPSNTYEDFRKYLECIFTYAGTLSLSKELESTRLEVLKPGDVFIQGGSPGHAVIVIDVALEPNTQEKLFLLAQSYMPAQEIQILHNPENDEISPWYSAEAGQQLSTPEWNFLSTDLKQFAE